jgi:hypothetical protein
LAGDDTILTNLWLAGRAQGPLLMAHAYSVSLDRIRPDQVSHGGVKCIANTESLIELLSLAPCFCGCCLMSSRMELVQYW